jgi:hypothetical protein
LKTCATEDSEGLPVPSELFQRLPRITTDEVATGRGEDAGRGRILASARQLVPPGATGAMLSARSPERRGRARSYGSRFTRMLR